MKTDFYTKTILTIIAICLLVLTFQKMDLIPSANAEAGVNTKNYSLVPVNADGTINVKLSGSGPLDVNIKEIDGNSIWGGKIPVVVKEN